VWIFKYNEVTEYAFVVILVCTLADGNTLLEFWNVNLWGVAVASSSYHPGGWKWRNIWFHIMLIHLCFIGGNNSQLMDHSWKPDDKDGVTIFLLLAKI